MGSASAWDTIKHSWYDYATPLTVLIIIYTFECLKLSERWAMARWMKNIFSISMEKKFWIRDGLKIDFVTFELLEIKLKRKKKEMEAV